MFEDVTYEAVLDEMLANALELYPELDTREGSVLYTAMAPAAVEIVNLYIALDTVLDMSYPDTASREYLIRRAAERGIEPAEATKAVIEAAFEPEGLSVPAGSRFRCDDATFAYHGETLDTNFLLTCETAGSVGNKSGGTLLPLAYIDGLQTASIVGLAVPGSDEEDTETLRQRYFDSFDSQAFGGNVKDYKEKVGSISGVGGVRVYPAWKGGGTVKLIIIGSDYAVPSDALINMVQTEIDPAQSGGEGLGLAPIGHRVTVTGAEAVSVNVDTKMTLADGWSWSDAEPYAQAVVDDYFMELAKSWADADKLVVRVSQLESRLLELEAVEDIADTMLNGGTGNLALGDGEIPVRGDLLG